MTMPRSSSTMFGYGDDVYFAGPTQWQTTALDMILEYVPELAWPLAGDIYNRMRNDGQLAGSLRAYTLPIRRAEWKLDPAGCRPTVYRQIADDLGLPILGQDQKPTGARRRGVVWSDHLRVSLTLNAIFGHAPFEQTYDTSTGTARLATLQERLPKTISRIFVDEATGRIQSVEQNRYAGQPNMPRIQGNALVWYVNDREGLGWRGRSLMRPSYPYWLIKDQMLRVHAGFIRKAGMGVPYANVPRGSEPQIYAEAERAISTFQANDRAGLMLPNGVTAGIAGITGSTPDTLAFIKYLDSQMSVSFLTQWLNLGTTETGARSLAESFIAMFNQSIQDFGDAHADQATAQLVIPLVDANWGESEPAPRIVCGNVGANHAVTAESIAALYACGALTGDAEIENALRQMYKLPLRDPNAPRPVAVPAVPATEPAPVAS